MSLCERKEKGDSAMEPGNRDNLRAAIATLILTTMALLYGAYAKQHGLMLQSPEREILSGIVWVGALAMAALLAVALKWCLGESPKWPLAACPTALLLAATGSAAGITAMVLIDNTNGYAALAWLLIAITVGIYVGAGVAVYMSLPMQQNRGKKK